MENKLTAVEWLEQEFIALQNYGVNELGLFLKAKAMEKEQMREIYSSPITTNEDGNFVIKSFEQYYKETYGK